MNDENTSRESEPHTTETWPRKLNKVLIGVGVIAFGLIIADRLVDMFRADDLPVPDSVDIVRESDKPSVAAAEPVKADIPEEVVIPTNEEPEVVLNIEDVFGSRLVFVSASEPKYVITSNDRRIDIGEEIEDGMTLSGITVERLIVDKSGDLLPISLPEPAVQ